MIDLLLTLPVEQFAVPFAPDQLEFLLSLDFGGFALHGTVLDDSHPVVLNRLSFLGRNWCRY